ncbi:hypothetical protein PR048_031409 [Dryococelus australis]|uniref:Uncharacterized protein n=1 Tax=Dryococelus australis TaxID=614101 RepID=A0ABQ9G573_9NEOP|nr:hypothetical protein PR048_031409 [Dryococelus australis]
MKGWGKREIPRKPTDQRPGETKVPRGNRRPKATSAKFPTCKNPSNPARNRTQFTVEVREEQDPEKTLRPAASLRTIPTCKNLGVTPLGICSKPGNSCHVHFLHNEELHLQQLILLDNTLRHPSPVNLMSDSCHIIVKHLQQWDISRLMEQHVVAATKQHSVVFGNWLAEFVKYLGIRVRRVWSSAEMQGQEKQEIPKKTCQPAALSGTIPTCENSGVTPLGIKPCLRRFGRLLMRSQEPIKVKRAGNGAVPECKGEGKWEISKKTRRPVVLSGKIPTCKNPGVTRTGTEPSSPWWKVNSLTTQPSPEARYSNKGVPAKHAKCTTVAKCKALNWHVVFSSCSVHLRDFKL